jgi:hypothetical protein
MPQFTEPEEPEFIAAEARHRWFYNVMRADYGEIAIPDDTDVPDALNWLMLVPKERRNDFEDTECSFVYLSPDGSYCATVWDAMGPEEDGLPWAVFWVDDFGPRLLTEYSLFDEEVTEEMQETILRRAAEEIPERAERGQFTRTGTSIMIPDWLMVEESDEIDEEE